MYIENRYYIRPGVIEVEQVHSSMIGRHNSRSKKGEPSAEAVKRNNRRRRAKELRRRIDANFVPGDIYMTLTYKKGTEKTLKDVKHDLSGFLRRLRYRYKKDGQELRYIAVVGIKSPHVHIIINSMDEINYMKEIPKIWQNGFVDIKPLYMDGRYMALAEYLIKHKDENEKKLGISLEGERAYIASRNLKIPRKRVVRINERTILRKVKVPTGYHLDMNMDLDQGVCKDTGYHYRYFMLIRTERKRE